MKNPIYAVDFGAGSALAIHGPNGPITKRDLQLPRVKGGKTPAMEFLMIIRALLEGDEGRPGGHVVFESPTIGSSGCEPAAMVDLVADYPHLQIYTIPARAVKNYRLDNNLPHRKGARYARDGQETPVMLPLERQDEVHAEDAEIIYRIATERPDRLHHWRGPSYAIDTRNSSVMRPDDKHKYRNPRSEMRMALLPEYSTLPDNLKETFGNGEEYSRTLVLAFVAAATEESAMNDPKAGKTPRRRFEKIIGLYDRGYPSIYRRKTIDVMQHVAKAMTGANKFAEVTPEQRKAAWKRTQRDIRHLFHLIYQPAA